MECYIESVETKENEGKKYVQLNFAGCNFNCPWCNTPHLLHSKEEFLVALKEIKKQITESSVEGVLITGGEPLFQRLALMELCKLCKSIGLKVVVQTNASKPGGVQALLSENLVDALIIDFKTPLIPSAFDKVTHSSTFFIKSQQIIDDFKASLDIIKKYEREIEIEFVTTVIPSLVFRKEDFLAIANKIQDIECRWCLTKFQPGDTVSNNFSDLKPPSDLFLEDLKENIQKSYPQLRIDLD
ncbi:MAG: radical SAM protein [Nanoarchaeota archaeon]